MSFNWCDYLTLAQELLRKDTVSSQEAKFRSAISRAYYGVYCTTRNHLIKKGSEFPKLGIAHKQVREILTKKGDNISKQIASNLARLWKDRKNADYEDQFPGAPGALDKTTTLDLSLAQKVIDDLAKC